MAKPPPRFPAPSGSMAALASSLTDFRINDTTPFHGSPIDQAIVALDHAHALTIALSIVTAGERAHDDLPIRPVHISASFDAIGSLVALASFFIREADPA